LIIIEADKTGIEYFWYHAKKWFNEYTRTQYGNYGRISGRSRQSASVFGLKEFWNWKDQNSEGSEFGLKE